MRLPFLALVLTIMAWLCSPTTTRALSNEEMLEFHRGDNDNRPIVVLPFASHGGGKPANIDARQRNQVIAGLMRQPRLYYPVAAKLSGIEGQGVCLVRFDTVTCRARGVTVTESSDEWMLDQAAVRVFRVWHIQPHTYDKIYVQFKYEEKGGTSYISSCTILIPVT